MFERLIWVVPVAVAVLGAWRPRAGLVALAAALPFFGSPPGGPYLGALDAAGLAAIATAWRGGRAAPSRLGWPALALVLVSLASLFPSPYAPPSWRPGVLVELARALPGVEAWTALYSWRAAADLLLGWGLFVAVRRAFAGRSLRPLAWALAGGLGLVLALGLAVEAGLLDLDGFRPRYGVHRAEPRLASVFFLSGWLAQYLVLVLPVAVAALASGRRRWRWRWPATAALLATATAALGLTQQRGAWLAAAFQLSLAIALVAPSLMRRRQGLRKAALATAATGVLAIAVFTSTGGTGASLVRRVSAVENGLGPRSALWSAAVEMTRAKPLLGWGLGTYAAAYDLAHPRGTEGARPYRETAHNLYLHVAAERGVLGLVALGLVGWAAGGCLRRARPGVEPLALGLAIGLAGMAFYGLVQYVFYLRAVAWLIWILLACAALVAADRAAPAAAESDPKRVRATPVARAGRIVAAIALVLLPFRAFGRAPAYAGNRSFGFHEAEPHAGGAFAWAGRYAAWRIPASATILRLALANGHPRAGERSPVRVALGVDGEPVAELVVEGGWREHTIDLGAARPGWRAITLEVEPTFRPFRDYRQYEGLRASTDIRELGVAVKYATEATSPAE